MIIEILKSIVLGIVEGITEWLPISSTGHMIIVDEFVKLDVSAEFLAMFLVVIQIGAIMAVVMLYFHKLNPFSRRKTAVQRKRTWRLWGMVLVGCIPAAVFGLLLDDWVNEHFYNAVTVAAMLILYGIVFVVLERRNRRKARELRSSGAAALGVAASSGALQMPNSGRGGKHIKDPNTGRAAGSVGAAAGAGIGEDVWSGQGMDAANETQTDEESIFRITDVDQIDIKTALKIGFFQILAIIPGTSRSGATIIGGMLSGASRSASAEFTFFLAIPIMLGWGLVKAAKFVLGGLVMTQTEIAVLVSGVLVAFAVSVVSIRFLMGYIKKNDFSIFGWYRIAIGVLLLLFFGLTGQLTIMQ